MPTNTIISNPQRVVIAGGSGFIGTHLADALVNAGYQVVVLSRRPAQTNASRWKTVKWDGAHIGDWAKSIDGAYAVINLAGKNVNCRYTQNNLNIVDMSRVRAVTVMAEAINQAQIKPTVLIQSSTTAIYGHTGDDWIDETAPTGFDTPHSTVPVATATYWENAFDAHPTPGVRRVTFRISFALGNDGGALRTLTNLTRLYLGGQVGNGRQYISWIHINDLTRLFVNAIENPGVTGLYNATSPNPVTNTQFMKQLRQALGRPWSPPTPATLVRIGAFFMRTEPVLALTGRRVRPGRLIDESFDFEYDTLDAAFQNIFNTERKSGATTRPQAV